MKSSHHDVVIVGGGFGGLHAAQSLRHSPVKITLLDRRNFHLFQPLLYQVATGSLSPANIAAPLRRILNRQENVHVLLAEVTSIDARSRRVLLNDGEISYDTLIVASGVTHHYFGKQEWGALAPGLKTIEDATEIRKRILYAFEAAERESDQVRLQEWLTFVIVGGGPTGVELAGALGEIANDTLKRDFRTINPADARILLLEAGDRILSTYPPQLSNHAVFSLVRLGVTVQTGSLVTDIGPDTVTTRRGDNTETIHTRTVLWAAGVQASSLSRSLQTTADASLDQAGRVMVELNLSLPRHPEIFVIGDLCCFTHQTGKPLPGVAPVAIQQGRYVARLIERRLQGEALPPFHYKDCGNLATIGRAAAVADLNWIRFSGFFAWLAWLFIHLMNIVEFENRLLVFVQWAWNYFSRNRAARLITGVKTSDLEE